MFSLTSFSLHLPLLQQSNIFAIRPFKSSILKSNSKTKRKNQNHENPSVFVCISCKSSSFESEFGGSSDLCVYRESPDSNSPYSSPSVSNRSDYCVLAGWLQSCNGVREVRKIDRSFARSDVLQRPQISSITNRLLPSMICNHARGSHIKPLYATLNNPRGFGQPPNKTDKAKKPKRGKDNDDDEDDDEEDGEKDPDAGVIPEIVTNRMMSRMAFTVGIPLFVGLLFFPFFYYLKVVMKIDIPTWVPFIVSFVFFGTALLGVSYGIVSSSWDPLREGSVLGWNEARKNWPVFWQSFRGGSERR